MTSKNLLPKEKPQRKPPIFGIQMSQNRMIVWCITSKTVLLRYYSEYSQNSKDFNELIEACIEKLR